MVLGGNYVVLHLIGKIVTEGIGGGVGPALGVDFFVAVGDMALHGSDAQDQLSGNLLVALAGGDEPQHLYLAPGQAVRVGRSLLWLRRHLVPVPEADPGSDVLRAIPLVLTVFRSLLISA